MTDNSSVPVNELWYTTTDGKTIKGSKLNNPNYERKNHTALRANQGFA